MPSKTSSESAMTCLESHSREMAGMAKTLSKLPMHAIGSLTGRDPAASPGSIRGTLVGIVGALLFAGLHACRAGVTAHIRLVQVRSECRHHSARVCLAHLLSHRIRDGKHGNDDERHGR